MDVLLEEMTSVLEASMVVSVTTIEGTVIFSDTMTVCQGVFVSRGSGPRDDFECVSNSVVSESPAPCVENNACPLSKDVTTGVVSLGVSVPAGADGWDSFADVVVPTLVTAVFPELWSPSVAVETSEITRA